MRAVFVRCLVTGGLLLISTGCGGTSTARPSSPATNLAGQCAASVGSDGYGIVDVTRDLTINNGRVEITVDCTIHLHNTATLTISGSELKTRNLIVSDDKPDARGSNVKITGSTLTGVGKAALVIDLRHRPDVISVHQSTIDYGQAVWMFAGGMGPGSDMGGGIVEVTDSTVRSTDSASRGIRIVAGSGGGVGTFVNDSFQTPSSNGLAILYAGTCHEDRVTGASGACS